MPDGKSVGTRVGQFVELDTLRAYLSSQYEGMGGADIAGHRNFGRRFKNGEDGAVTVVLIPVEAVADYLETQYAGMGGCDIAEHEKFLRNIPTVRVSDLSLNLV